MEASLFDRHRPPSSPRDRERRLWRDPAEGGKSRRSRWPEGTRPKGGRQQHVNVVTPSALGRPDRGRRRLGPAALELVALPRGAELPIRGPWDTCELGGSRGRARGSVR